MAETPKPPPPQLPVSDKQLSVWQKLKLHVARRHDYFEGEYKVTNFPADESKAAFYREIFETMKSLEENDAQASKKG